MPNLTRAQILARKTGRDTVTLPDGSTIGIRALTRDEALEMQELKGLGNKDTYMIATGMTDPMMTVEDVAKWAKSGDAGDLVIVSKAITELSGMGEGAGKSRVSGVRGQPRA